MGILKALLRQVYDSRLNRGIINRTTIFTFSNFVIIFYCDFLKTAFVIIRIALASNLSKEN